MAETALQDQDNEIKGKHKNRLTKKHLLFSVLVTFQIW